MQGVFDFHQDLPIRPKRPERLFFGLFPDTETSVRVGQFTRRFLSENQWKGRPLETERLHVSLHHVGDYERLRTKFIYAARQAGEAISMRPFEVTFRFIKSFEGAPPIDGRPRGRPLVLLGEGDALVEFHKILGAAMRKNGLRAAEHFTPHITLSYGPKPIPRQAIEPLRFVANEFALIHSKRGLTQYDLVDRWSLHAAPRGSRTLAAMDSFSEPESS
jgi:2'-5' RNA ligase